MMTTVSKAHALKTNEARILCIAGGKNCGAEMARQPARVSAIKTGMAKPGYRVRVELIEIRIFFFKDKRQIRGFVWNLGTPEAE